jgi:hypothetical protein
MKKSASMLPVLLFLSFVLVSLPEPHVAKAETNTIVVPDDYPTITAAIGNASEGDTIFIKAGVYEERSLLINKTLTVMGEDANSTIIKNMDVSNWNPLNPFPPPGPVAVQISANNVTVSGFTITCEYGYWVPIEATANGTQIIGNIMNKSDGISINGNYNTVAQNSFMPSLRNSFIGCSGSHNTIESNTMVGSGGTRSKIVGSFNVIHNNTVTGVHGGFGVSGIGNLITNNNSTTVMRVDGTENIFCNNIIASNLAFSGHNNTFYCNYMNGIVIGDTQTDAANNTFYHNYFDFVEYEVLPAGEKTFTVWVGVHGPIFLDNGKEGNYWNDYNGTDNNRDGIGDTPYIIYANDTRNYHYIADFDIANIILTDHYPLMAPITVFDAGTWEGTSYNVDVISNSTVSKFSFNPESAQIQFEVDGETVTTGFCRVTIPKGMLCTEGNWIILMDGAAVTPTVNEDTNNTYLYFTYQHSTKTVEIIGTTAIPEFPSWIILPLLITATLMIMVCKRKLTKNRQPPQSY